MVIVIAGAKYTLSVVEQKLPLINTTEERKAQYRTYRKKVLLFLDVEIVLFQCINRKSQKENSARL